MNATALTIQLPQPEIAFLKDYAERHQVTVSEVIDYFVKQLRVAEKYSFHPDIERFAGMIPKEVDVRKEYYEYLEEKHR